MTIPTPRAVCLKDKKGNKIMNFFDEALCKMEELYGKDTSMPLATVKDGKADLRVVNAYYKEKSFYITTYALSEKMKEIARNPSVALCHNLFVAHGNGRNIGHPLAPQNRELRGELRKVFCAFYDKHVKEADEHTCLLRIDLTDALVFADDYKYFIDFQAMTATRENCVVDIVF